MTAWIAASSNSWYIDHLYNLLIESKKANQRFSTPCNWFLLHTQATVAIRDDKRIDGQNKKSNTYKKQYIEKSIELLLSTYAKPSCGVEP